MAGDEQLQSGPGLGEDDLQRGLANVQASSEPAAAEVVMSDRPGTADADALRWDLPKSQLMADVIEKTGIAADTRGLGTEMTEELRGVLEDPRSGEQDIEDKRAETREVLGAYSESMTPEIDRHSTV